MELVTNAVVHIADGVLNYFYTKLILDYTVVPMMVLIFILGGMYGFGRLCKYLRDTDKRKGVFNA